MWLSLLRLTIVLLSCLCLAGCKESPSKALRSESQTDRAPREAVARIHWLGKNRIAADTNATDLMTMWGLPESDDLEAQTLGKLASVPWKLLGQPVDSNAVFGLRPLLADLVRNESYIEIRSDRGDNGEIAIAIRLEAEQARVWETNLAIVVESLTGHDVASATASREGWTLRTERDFNVVEFTRIGEWTILGMARDRNDAIADFLQRIQTMHVPFESSSNGCWLEVEAEMSSIVSLFLSEEGAARKVPKLTMRVTGDGQYVRTTGHLDFPAPLSLDLEPWNVPTNLIKGDVRSLTAVRGLSGLPGVANAWKTLKIGDAPGQLFMWGLPGLPPQVYLAAPSSQASNYVTLLSDRILQVTESTLSSDAGVFEKAPEFHGLRWNGVPYLYPFLAVKHADDSEWVLGGTVLVKGVNEPPPSELIDGLFERTNQVYYDREFTGGQIEQWLFISQFTRFIFDCAQLTADSAGIRWLRALIPRIGSSGTDILQTGPAQLSFARTSGLGLTALELNLLVDWLESPDFPFGLHSQMPDTAVNKSAGEF